MTVEYRKISSKLQPSQPYGFKKDILTINVKENAYN